MWVKLVIIIFLAIASVVFYLSIYGYLYLIVKKLISSKPARIALWLGFVFWVLVFMVIEGMVMHTYFQNFNKALIAFGIAISIFFHKNLWQQFNKLISS
jgi:hypothetical protein